MQQPSVRIARPWRRLVALWIGLFVVYAINGREIGAADTIPALLQPVTLLRGDGLVLDRFQHLWPDELPYYVARQRGAIVSRYPLGPPVLAVPFTFPQLLVLDRLVPDWEATPGQALSFARQVGKITSAAIGASTGVVIYLMLSALQLGPLALPTTLIAALGSTLWISGSQSLWQHGPAALALTSALTLLLPRPRQRWRLVLAGGACGLLVHCRPQLLIMAVLIFAWVVVEYRSRALWFVILPLLLGTAFVGHNLWYFDSILGGYGWLMEVAARDHDVSHFWTADVTPGLLGTLFSPSRGLFIFSPWIPLSLAMLPATAPALRRWPLVCTVLCGLPVFFVQLILQSTWWAGWSFGPRYWTEVLPLFAVLLGFALSWAQTHSRPLRTALLVAGAWAVAVQAIGAFCYPSSFNSRPGNIDKQHERLWSWRDGELARCLHEGPHGWD